MQCFLTGTESSDAKAFHGRRELMEHGGLLLQRQPRKQILDTVTRRKPRITEKRLDCSHG
ncbi:hypothetical protein ACIOWG_29455 [Streptomyces sp. NPDC087658]|uniref:hypothetical protein n=1 Tax=Streptomyces sp. NPDC087658 TaxID=3365800 RepID=UPI00382EF2B9